MPQNAAGLNLGAAGFAAGAAYLALHSADPGTTGTSPTTAARVAAGWTTSNGVATATGKSFTGGAASGAVTHVGYWSALTGGTFYGSRALTGDQAFNAAGQYNTGTITETYTSS